jgi:hypothetical protein
MNLKSLDEARALDYDQSMAKARIAFAGVKDTLNVYGFSLDQTLDSVQTKVVSNDGKNASVQLHYTLLGAPLDATAEMVNVDGRWYGKQMMEKLKEKAAAASAGEAVIAPPPPAAAPETPPKG